MNIYYQEYDDIPHDVTISFASLRDDIYIANINNFKIIS